MKIILIFAAVPAFASDFANLRLKGFFQHHRVASHDNRPISTLSQQSMDRLTRILKQHEPKAASGAQRSTQLFEITGNTVIEEFLNLLS